MIEEVNYLADPDGVVLIPGAAQAIQALRGGGYAVVVVTNQSGIGRGILSLAQYQAVASRVSERLAESDVEVDATYFCPDDPDEEEGGCRKPGTAMYEAAARDLDLDLVRSAYVGDKVTDVLPGLTLGGRPILVRTGYGSEQESRCPAEVEVVDDLSSAARKILAFPPR